MGLVRAGLGHNNRATHDIFEDRFQLLKVGAGALPPTPGLSAFFQGGNIYSVLPNKWRNPLPGPRHLAKPQDSSGCSLSIALPLS